MSAKIAYLRKNARNVPVHHSTKSETHKSSDADEEQRKVVAFMETYWVVDLAHRGHKFLASSRMRVMNIPRRTRIGIGSCHSERVVKVDERVRKGNQHRSYNGECATLRFGRVGSVAGESWCYP